MSRKLLAFLLSELKLIRIVCKNCGTVAEMNLDALAAATDRASCHFCKKPFAPPNWKENPFAAFAGAVGALKADGVNVDIEFVLTDDSK